MKGAILLAVLILLAYLQVTAAPFLTISAAQADLLLISLALLMVYQGPKVAMVSLPLIALFLGFTSDRSPAVIILALLPLLPLAYWLEEAGAPISRFLQTLLAVGVTGMWARVLLAMTVVAEGASMQAGALVFSVVMPGLMLDILLLSLAYLVCRLLRCEPKTLAMPRERYRA